MSTTEIKISCGSLLFIKVGNSQIRVSYSENQFGKEEVRLSVIKPSKARLVDDNTSIKIEQPTLEEIDELRKEISFYFGEGRNIPNLETKIE